MKCLKCGTAIGFDQVFCATCQEDMERHPVKPGTPIVLPERPERASGKVSHKRVRKPEERVANLRTLVFWLILLIVALGTVLAITIWMLLTETREIPYITELIQRRFS